LQRRLIACAITAGVLGFAGVAHSAATTFQTADRLERYQATPTLPPPPQTAREVCNIQTYIAYDPGPSRICWRAVTAERGWTQAEIDAWQPFVIDEFSGVLQGESVHCWNLRFGDRVNAGEPCTQARLLHRGEDAGFGAATLSWYGRNATLCKNHGVCSAEQIVAEPYTSMLYSVVLLVEYDGRGPWCFRTPWDAWYYHDCWEAPGRYWR
jgi:hypothetical protein